MEAEMQRFVQLQQDITLQCQVLKEKQEAIDSRQNRGELKPVWVMESWSAADNISNLEANIFREKKNQNRVDMKIVSLYLKVLSLQSAKINTFLSRLHQLSRKTNFQGMPDFTIQSYQEWLRTNPKIHALQSEILDLLGQKVKALKILGEDGRLHENVFHKTEMSQRLDIQKLHSQTFFFVENDPLVDSDFSCLVSEITSIESASFESNKMREFVHFCWNKNEDDALHKHCYQEFVAALSEHILTKYGHLRKSGTMKTDITRDQIFGIIEGHLIPHISQQIFKKSPNDDILNKQYKRLNKLTQKEIGVKPCYIDPSPCPYEEAIVKLKGIEIARLPTQKMRLIILAAQAVLNKMASLDCTSVTSADEFMDVWVFVTIQAQIKKLFTNINFLRNFSNPSYMLSETGYYLSSLELAAEYIKAMRPIDFKQDEQILFVLFDSYKLKQNHALKSFELVEEFYELIGYEAFVVMEWLTVPSRLTSAIFKENLSCSCVVSKWKTKCDLVTLKGIVLKDSNMFVELVLVKDFYVPVLKSRAPERTTLVRMNTSFDCCKKNLIKYSNLVHLNINLSFCISDYINIEKELKSMCEEFENEFYPFLHMKHKGVDNIVVLLKNALSKIYSYKDLYQNDCFNGILWKLVQKFQLNYNALCGTGEMLRDDGVCDSRTLRAVLEKTKEQSLSV